MKISKPPCGSPTSPWELKTYGGKGARSMDLRRATLSSDNSVYAQLVSDLGPDKVKETARMMGIKSKLLGVCAETLGGLHRRRLAARRWPTPTRRSSTAATATARA